MSLYTAGEILVWLVLAAILGGVLGWLLRGILRSPTRGRTPTPVIIRDEHPATTVAEIDTGASGTFAEPVDSIFAPASARDRVREIATRAAGVLTPPHDDLQRIRGVGPKMAGLLSSMGLTSYRQVARLTPDDVSTVNEALGVFPGRIDREGWVASARQLHREVYGVEP